MGHPIRELAKLTTKSKQIDGMGFGGRAPDNLEVAGMLGMRSPVTGNKLSRQAYQLARFAYCGDHNCRAFVKSSLLGTLLEVDTGNIKDVTLAKMINAALREFMSPEYKRDKTGVIQCDVFGEPILAAVSGREFAKRLGIKHQSITQFHQDIYAQLYQTLCEWNSDALRHIKAHLDKDSEAA